MTRERTNYKDKFKKVLKYHLANSNKEFDLDIDNLLKNVCEIQTCSEYYSEYFTDSEKNYEFFSRYIDTIHEYWMEGYHYNSKNKKENPEDISFFYYFSKDSGEEEDKEIKWEFLAFIYAKKMPKKGIVCDEILWCSVSYLASDLFFDLIY